MSKKIKKVKENILNALENKKVIQVKVSFKGRLGIFWIGWKHIRNFPDYSLGYELKRLFFPPKLECLIK